MLNIFTLKLVALLSALALVGYLVTSKYNELYKSAYDSGYAKAMQVVTSSETSKIAKIEEDMSKLLKLSSASNTSFSKSLDRLAYTVKTTPMFKVVEGNCVPSSEYFTLINQVNAKVNANIQDNR